jgi:GNAT superfamily N-acetyltransferase
MPDIEFYEEPIHPTYHQLDDLLHEYFAKTIAAEGLPRLNMNWPAYIMLNERDDLVLFTARTEKFELLGFVMYFIHPHLHHAGITNAACDIIATDLKMRGKGIARMLIEYAESRLRNRGVHFITHQSRTCYDVEPLFPKLGYTLIEQGYLKDIR